MTTKAMRNKLQRARHHNQKLRARIDTQKRHIEYLEKKAPGLLISYAIHDTFCLITVHSQKSNQKYMIHALTKLPIQTAHQ